MGSLDEEFDENGKLLLRRVKQAHEFDRSKSVDF